MLVTDMNKIHYDAFSAGVEQKIIKRVVDDYGIQRIYLPPQSPDFNPLESLFQHLKSKLPKRDLKTT